MPADVAVEEPGSVAGSGRAPLRRPSRRLGTLYISGTYGIYYRFPAQWFKRVYDDRWMPGGGGGAPAAAAATAGVRRDYEGSPLEAATLAAAAAVAPGEPVTKCPSPLNLRNDTYDHSCY